MRNKEPQTPMGKRIRQRRKELKMTQEKLGKMIHVTANTISRWEFDGYEPELTLAVCLADALRVSLDWLVCGRLAFTAPCAVGDKVYEVIQDGGGALYLRADRDGSGLHKTVYIGLHRESGRSGHRDPLYRAAQDRVSDAAGRGTSGRKETRMSNRADRRAEARERANRYRRAMAAWYEQEPPRWRLIAWMRWWAAMPR